MARREKGKYQKREAKQSTEVEIPAGEMPAAPAQPAHRLPLLPYLLVFAFGFLLYVNTIPFDYTLDDKLYITANEYTKKGLDGLKEIWTNDMMTGFFGKKKNLVEGGRYRPLALTTHAIEYEYFGQQPHLSHFINVVLYGLTGVVLLVVLKMIFGWREEKYWWSIPFVATLLFLAHPTHTEVTANIKSRDEIMSLLFALLAFRSVLVYLQHGKTLHLLWSGLWFFLSLLSKESTVTFLGVVPLTLIFYPRGSLRQSAIACAPMFVFTLAYVALRWMVFKDQGASLEVAKELMNKPYLEATDSERLASIFFTMGLYLKLLVWPHPLTHDYYPFHPFRTYSELVAGANPYYDWSNTWAVLSLAAYVLLLAYGLWALWRKLRGGPADIFGYGILLYLGTFILFSNLFFDIGAFMNERFLFIPSMGFCLVVAYLLVEKAGQKGKLSAGLVLFGLVLAGFTGKTFVRNYAWANDYALASSDAGTSDGSAKIKMTMGSELLDKAKEQNNEQMKQQLLKEAETYCLQSLQIYPKYFPPLDILGNIYFEMGNYEYSVHYFEQALKLKPNDNRLLTNMEAVGNRAVQASQLQPAIRAYEVAAKLRRGKDRSRIYSALGEVYGKNLNDLENSMKYLRLARQEDPANASAYQKIGIVFAMTGQSDSAMWNFNRALELDPKNARVMLNLAILYKQLGNAELGNKYMEEAVRLDPTIRTGE